MSRSLSRRTWDSRSDLFAHLGGTKARTLLLGNKAEAPRAYYSFSVVSSGATAEIGVVSSGLGTEVTALLLNQGQQALVGHDSWLTSIEMDRLAVVAQIHLGGVFYEFLPVDREDEILVLHEVGMLRVDGRAAVKWSVKSDIVESWRSDGKGNVILTVMDGPPLVVSLASGAVSS